MKAVALVALLPLAGAFVAPMPKTAARGRSLKMSFENEAGVTAPLGFWDPLGLSKDADQELFNVYRAQEIKHGRIAQLAMLHYWVTGLGIRFPGLVTEGDGIPASMPAGFDAIWTGAWPLAGVVQVILFTSALELLTPQDPNKIPGDVQPDTPQFRKLDSRSPEEALALQNKEINNGRLAMVAWAGAQVGIALTHGEQPLTTLLSKLSL